MNKFEKYFEDYRVLMDARNQFDKEHWCGNLILFAVALVVAFGIAIGVIYLINNKEKIKNKFKKIKNKFKKITSRKKK